jgi:hypothetical protein
MACEIWTQDILDKRLYVVDFVDVLGSTISIASVSWDNPSALTAEYTTEAASISGTTVKNYFSDSAASEDTTYEVSVTITTDETIARKFTHTFKIKIADNCD